MDQILQQGIAAAKAGNKPLAFNLLSKATRDAATAEQAWLWLSGVAASDPERLFCLNNALKSNPNNAAAQRGAAMLREKGIFPRMIEDPTPPEEEARYEQYNVIPESNPQAYTPPSNRTSPPPAPSTSFEKTSAALPAQPRQAPKISSQELKPWMQSALMELEANKPLKEVEKILISRGAAPHVAKQVVEDAQIFKRAAARAKYKGRMVRGLLLLMGGCGISFATMVLSDLVGGSFSLLFYGAILWGLVDLVVGAIGWTVNL